MIFAILLIDRPGTAELRIQVRPEHRAYLGKLADKMAFAGPLTSEDGKTYTRQLFSNGFSKQSRCRGLVI